MFTPDSKDFQSRLPPRFRLNSVSKPAGSVREWDSAHEASVSVGPIRVGREQPQHRPAEELAARTDLRCDRKLSQPAAELGVAVLRRGKTFGVVKPALKRQGNILGKKHLGSHTERCPVVEAVARQAVAFSLENKNRHDGETVVGLHEQVLRDQQSLGALYEGIRVIN